MGLKKDLVIAKIRAAQHSNKDFVLSQKQMGIYEVQAEYEAKAILNFLTNPELKFTIKELKASVELEDIETSDTLDANIKMTRTISMTAIQIKIIKMLVELIMAPIKYAADIEIAGAKPLAPLNNFIQPINQFFNTIMKQLSAIIPKVEGQNEIEIPALDLKKSGGQGSALKAVGHAYIGINDPVPGSDTNVEASENDFTSVVLLADNIPPDIVDNVETGEEDYDVPMEG